MNIAKVTYEDKEAIQNDETIAEKNKVTANNMNQIKKAINDNADFLTEVKNTVDELNGDVGNIKIVQTAQNSTISNMNNAIEQNSKEIYENSNNIIALQKENTALKEELERQKEDNKLNGLTEDNEGELLHITNTTGARFNSLEIFGNEKQETREGYNKLENHLQSQTINGVNIVINSDKSITLNGTATAFFQLILLDTDDTPIILSPKTYTMSLKGKILGINFVGTENGVDVPYLASTVTTESVQKTYQSETTITKILCAISQGTQLNNVKLYPMIYEGTDEKEYEEYGAMPSFDYPSEVKAVGGNVNIFNDEVYKGFEVTQQNYNALEKVDLKLEANKFYVAKIWFEDGTYVATNDSNFMLYGYKADGTLSMNIPNGIAKTYSNATELVKAKIVANSTGLSTYANKVVSGIKIEEVENADGQPSQYSNYEQGCIELKVENKNVFSFEKAKRLATYAMPSYEVIDNNNIELKNSNDWAYIQYQYTLKKNTQYTISFDLEFEGVDNVTQWWTTIEDSLGSIVTNYVTLINNKYIKTFSTREDSILKIKFYASTVINPTLTIIKNIQIEEKNSVTDYIAHEEQSFVVPVQQKMFAGDKFVKINGVWKEMHTIGEATSQNNQNVSVYLHSSSGKFFRYWVYLGNTGQKVGDRTKIWSNYFAYKNSRWQEVEGVCGWENGQKFCIGTFNKNFDTADKLKTFLLNNPVIFYYELAEPLYLDCTKEQIEILDKIEQEAHTYLDTTNVYTEDEVGAIIKTNTNVDLKSLINNIQEQLIAE